MALTQADVDLIWAKTLQNPDTLAMTSAGTWLRWSDKREVDTRTHVTTKFTDLNTRLDALELTVNNIKSILDDMSSDPADEPPANIIVAAVRYAIANP